MNRCVESYCATVTSSSATVPSGQYATYDGASSSKTLSVLSTPTLLPKMKMGGQLLLENKRRMDPRVWIKKKRTKESKAEMKLQWDSSVVPRTYKIEKEGNSKDYFI